MNFKDTAVQTIQTNAKMEINDVLNQLNRIVIHQFAGQGKRWNQLLNQYYLTTDLQKLNREQPNYFNADIQTVLQQPDQPSYYKYRDHQLIPVTTQMLLHDVQNFF